MKNILSSIFNKLENTDKGSFQKELVSFSEENSLLQNLLENIPMELAIYDLESHFVYINKLYHASEKQKKELIGKSDRDYFEKAGIDLKCLEKRRYYFKKTLQEKKTLFFTERLLFPKLNKFLYYKRFYQPIFTDKKKKEISKICFFGNNITAILLSQRELKYVAYHDKLTGLGNRDALNYILGETILDSYRENHEATHALLFCDLDNFKLVNDTIGHDVGDLVLRETALRMTNVLRQSDHIFRLGGDEFTVILKNVHLGYGPGEVAQKLINIISKPYQIKDHKITCLSASVGISLFPKDGKEKETLLKKADTAMYQAKSKGKNGYRFFNEAMTRETMEKLAIVNRLRELIQYQNYDDQFSLKYQPIVRKNNWNDIDIIGMEALLRWKDPEIGIIGPNKFIPIAEETNLIDAIGEWVFTKVCTDITDFNKRTNSDLFVSVNFSAKQLNLPDAALKIEKLIKETDVKPEYLQLELTETAYLNYKQEVIRNIRLIKELGINLAIDDFGVGYASLAYLQKIPASTLKIDKSFIKNMSVSQESEDFIKAILSLGQNLNKEIIAEGVETADQMNVLFEQDCNKFQGYYFCKPVKLSQIEMMMRKDYSFQN